MLKCILITCVYTACDQLWIRPLAAYQARKSNMFITVVINQQDAQNSCDQTLFSIRCSTCFGPYQSIIRSNFINYIAFGIRRYVPVYAGTTRLAFVWLQPHSSQTYRHISAYTGIYQMRCTTYKVAPDDELIQSET